jgi:hypothetical protein
LFANNAELFDDGHLAENEILISVMDLSGDFKLYDQP